MGKRFKVTTVEIVEVADASTPVDAEAFRRVFAEELRTIVREGDWRVAMGAGRIVSARLVGLVSLDVEDAGTEAEP